MPRFLSGPAISLALASLLPAQLNLQLAFKFVDNQAGGNGNIGVTQDERQFRYYVIDFSNTLTMHEFDLVGTFLSQWAPTCASVVPSPNDVTYDPVTDHLWIVDNSPNYVAETDRLGNCISSWSFVPPSTNAVGITYDRLTNTLWISSDSQVSQWSKTGTRLAGGFSFAPPGPSTILSGITHNIANDHFYITQSSGTKVFELTKTGTLVSTTDLASYGVVNTQGLHFSLLLQQLAVVDNTQSTTYVFKLGGCSGSVTMKGQGCKDPQGTPLAMSWTGCPDLAKSLSLSVATNAANTIPVYFFLGASDTIGLGVPLPLDLGLFGATGCNLYTSSDVPLGPINNPGGGASLPLTVPNDASFLGKSVFWQGIQLSPLIPTKLPVVTSNYLVTTFG